MEFQDIFGHIRTFHMLGFIVMGLTVVSAIGMIQLHGKCDHWDTSHDGDSASAYASTSYVAVIGGGLLLAGTAAAYFSGFGYERIKAIFKNENYQDIVAKTGRG